MAIGATASVACSTSDRAEAVATPEATSPTVAGPLPQKAGQVRHASAITVPAPELGSPAEALRTDCRKAIGNILRIRANARVTRDVLGDMARDTPRRLDQCMAEASASPEGRAELTWLIAAADDAGVRRCRRKDPRAAASGTLRPAPEKVRRTIADMPRRGPSGPPPKLPTRARP